MRGGLVTVRGGRARGSRKCGSVEKGSRPREKSVAVAREAVRDSASIARDTVHLS